MNLLLTGCYKYSSRQLNELKMLGYNLYFMESELYDELPLNPETIDAIVCNHFFTRFNFSDFKNLKLIQLTSAGLDRVPINQIKSTECKLYNARGVYNVPMAEWVIFRVLEQYKHGWSLKDEQDNKRWTKIREIREIKGVNVAIIGAGSIGGEVAKKFKAFDALVDGYDIYNHSICNFDNIFLIDEFKKRVNKYDIIVLTAPLLPSTKGIISSQIIEDFKENTILINISRGGLIDEKALYEVLTVRSDIFAILDVFEHEPLQGDSPLWDLNNIAISPHNSFVGDGNNARMYNVIYSNLHNFIIKED